MKRAFIWAFIVILLFVGGLFALNAYIYKTKQAPEKQPVAAEYFQERMITLGIEDIGRPIEGFDANLLIMAYPGLLPSDFDGVEAFEGRYDAEGTFVREQEMPVSSAERTVSDEGYRTLLQNLSGRLGLPAASEAEVDGIVSRINTAERVEARIDQGASIFGVKVIPHEVLEDSRCPANVNCVQAGTVRLRATLQEREQVFVLDEPVGEGNTEITLTQVDPVPQAGAAIAAQDYVFYFQISKK